MKLAALDLSHCALLDASALAAALHGCPVLEILCMLGYEKREPRKRTWAAEPGYVSELLALFIVGVFFFSCARTAI